ncbi:hypothetical protein [Prescottella agglutinans]|uniref:Uncharacterized protein n=1 Tax=Prescottella agglutinans TaxID=1644129 RepID=A0ABT6MKV6_9NOCA|nr:hypothetical protein [Prescottella agglutinans]MDH6284932.1 hypothetical protein [Prescottella agglutinans]
MVEVAAAAILFLAVAEFVNGFAYLLLASNDRGTGVGAMLLGAVVAAPLAYFLFKRSRGYAHTDPRGTVEGMRRHRKTIQTGAAVMAVGAVTFAAWSISHYGIPNDPTLSGAELEALLMNELGPKSGMPMYATSIRCPHVREYHDGESTLCAVERLDGARTTMEASIHRMGDSWKVNLDIG